MSVKCLDGFSFKRINVYPASRMRTPKKWFGLLIVLVCSACSGGNENAHTTATTIVSPPPRQVIKAEFRAGPRVPIEPIRLKMYADPSKPVLALSRLPSSIREGEEVVLDFSLANAQLKGDGGEYRVRYIVDDDEMQWIDRWEQVVLTGWIEGKHTIRVELVGPDGWPYRNGDYNITTNEITVVK